MSSYQTFSRPFCVRSEWPGWLLAAVLLGLALGNDTRAQGVIDLYQARVPVAGQQAEQRNQAIGEALAKVLVKVTGNRRILSRGDLKEAVANASRYAQEYSYRVESEQARYLDVTFDAQAVDRLLRARGLPVWGWDNRPSILVWMGIEEQGKRRLMVPDTDTSVRFAIESMARERGLPLLFPLLDLEDQGRLQVADLWGDFELNIRAASRRYSPDLILTGRLVRVSKGSWRGQWRLYQERSKADWNNQGKSPEAVAADALGHVADLLAKRFAPVVRESGLNLVRLRVSGVNSLADYAAVGRLLGAQDSLERITVASVEPAAVSYDLQLRSGIEALEQGLGIGGLLMPDPDAGLGFETPGGPEPARRDADLYYRVR